MEAYAFNPYHIVRAGYGRFTAVVKRRVNARFATLAHLFGRAKQSPRYAKTTAEVDLLVGRRRALWSDYKRLTTRRKDLRTQIEWLGEELKDAEDLPALDHLKGLTLFNLTRVIGQTGPADQLPVRTCCAPVCRSQSARTAKRQLPGANAALKEGASAAAQDPGTNDLPGAPASLPLRPVLPP
jgi:hypothetical protein